MNKIKLLVLAATATLTQAITANEYPWLTFTLSDNTEVSVASDNLSMNYVDGELRLTSPTVNQAFDIEKIKTMRFTTVTAGTGIYAVTACDELWVYSLSGTEIGRFASVEAARAALPSGVYVAKNESETFKIIF